MSNLDNNQFATAPKKMQRKDNQEESATKKSKRIILISWLNSNMYVVYIIGIVLISKWYWVNFHSTVGEICLGLLFMLIAAPMVVLLGFSIKETFSEAEQEARAFYNINVSFLALIIAILALLKS